MVLKLLPASHIEDDQEEWEVQDILDSHTRYRKLQYKAQWVGWHDDQEWYNAEALKRVPSPPRKYHSDPPKKPGAPCPARRLAPTYESGVEVLDHPDDNKPVAAKPTELKTGATGARFETESISVRYM